MERFVEGEIVVVQFPYTNFSSSRKRPALVLADLGGEDIILCEITSRLKRDNYTIDLQNEDLTSGKLRVRSLIKPNRILTIYKTKINYKFGKLKDYKLKEVKEKLSAIFNI